MKSTGVSDLMLRTVLGDLDKVKLVIYNREDATARLVQRMASLE